MKILENIDSISDSGARRILLYFLERYLNPAFGALPKKEVELIVLDVLERLGVIENEPKIYELVSKLKITRSKARSLIYDRDLRKSSKSELDSKVKNLLKTPKIQKNGSLFIIEVENPLVSDHLKYKVQRLGFITDGSFSPNIIKLGLDAISALVESYLDDDEKIIIQKALIKAGAPDGSFRGILKSAFNKIGSKIASESGEALIDNASEYFGPLLESGIGLISDKLNQLFKIEK